MNYIKFFITKWLFFHLSIHNFPWGLLKATKKVYLVPQN
jgi:hypothetical protein